MVLDYLKKKTCNHVLYCDTDKDYHRLICIKCDINLFIIENLDLYAYNKPVNDFYKKIEKVKIDNNINKVRRFLCNHKDSIVSDIQITVSICTKCGKRFNHRNNDKSEVRYHKINKIVGKIKNK